MINIINKYIGQKDKLNSTDFVDDEFGNRMREIGWKPDVRWCVYFAKLVWTEYYKENQVILSILDSIFKGRVIDTFKAFEDSEYFTISKEPVPGAIAFYAWEGAKTKESGTTILVISVEDKYYNSVELHYDRGDLKVTQSKRKINKPNTKVGLNLLGFVHPINN